MALAAVRDITERKQGGAAAPLGHGGGRFRQSPEVTLHSRGKS